MGSYREVRCVGVPHSTRLPDLIAFAAALATHRPRLCVVNSALHNPTGANLSLPMAHKLLIEAMAHDLIIVEDDICADLEPDLSPRLAALDGLDRVMRVGSYSKTLSASMRCGYIAAQPDWIEALVDLQVATNFGGPSPVVASLIAGALSDGSYLKHLEALRRRLSKARREVGSRLAALGITPWLESRGGFFLWRRLPEGLDAAAMARAALAEKVVLAPGNVFSVSQTSLGFLRFNVAQMADARVYDILSRALLNASPLGHQIIA